VPIAGFCLVNGDEITLTGLVASIDGKQVIKKASTGPADQAAAIGKALAEEILDLGGRAILEEVYQAEIS
jgi:hydroxymethylbilane synthase